MDGQQRKEQVQEALAQHRKAKRIAKREANKERKAQLKAMALDLSICEDVDKAHKAHFQGNYEPLQDCYRLYGFDLVQVCLALNASRRRKWQKCRDKINKAIETGNAYFLTLTFRDDVLEKTSEKTRRDYARKYLKSIAPVYVGNIDYGDKEKNPESNEREHYHAVAVCGVRPPKGGWPYGFSKIKKVGETEDDRTKVSKYVAKLSTHALKASTHKDGGAKCPLLIYSRNCLE